MKLAYDCFEVYQKLLQQENEWDVNDAVQNIYARCTSHPKTCESFVLETLAVDEVQDMNAVSLALLKFLLNGPGACDVIHYAGDAAQVINSAANFRFSDLKNLYFDIYLPHLAKTDAHIARMLHSKADAGRLVPRLKPLTMNYRSVESIVMLGNAILAWMTDYFPGCIDRLNPDHGLAQGGLPVFLELMSIGDFLARVVGTAANVDIGDIEFGADQAIIVRNAAAKRTVKQLVGQCAIVLDIKECKGLEFDDVILYNFFADSTFQRWRLLDPDAHPRVEFDPLRDQLLLFELKQLYVAVTRARTNLWIYDQSERGTAVRVALQDRQLVTTLKKAANGEVPVPLAKRSTPEEWNQAGLRFFKENNFEEALPCFVRSGNVTKERETRAYLHMKEADHLEGSRTSSSTRKAAREREQAGDLFQGLGRPRLAATQYQTAGLAVSSAMLLMKAADAWVESGKTEATGQSVLRCLVLAGSPAYKKLLSALEMEWIARDDGYWETVDTLAESFGEEACDSDLARILRLFRTLEERVQFLEDLGKKEAVEDLLRTSGEWERLGHSYEKSGELLKAEQAWKSARRLDVLERIRIAHANLVTWISFHQSGSHPQGNSKISLSSGTGRESSRLYFELLEFLGHSRKMETTYKDQPELALYQVKNLLTLVDEVHTRYSKFQDFSNHLCSGSFPDPLLVEDLGLYRTQHRELVYLIANRQMSKWENLDLLPTVNTSPGYTPGTSSQIAKILGRYCKEAAKRLERSVFVLTRRLWSWSTNSINASLDPQLKINAASAYGNHMLRFCVPDVTKLDDFILGFDRLIYPLVTEADSRVASVNWFNTTKGRTFLELIISHRQSLREEADSNVIITTLKWAIVRGTVLSLPPSNLLLTNLIEAIRWSALTPSSEVQPLAESALRLDNFFAAWAPQLVPRKAMQAQSRLGAGTAASEPPLVQHSVTAKSQLYVLERLFFAIVCLTNRFYETVLPTRLLEMEFTQGTQSVGAVGLLQRKPQSLRYLDKTSYWKEGKFQQIHQNLGGYLLGLLGNEQRLHDILETFELVERPVYVKGIIILAICLHCSGNLSQSDAKADIYNLHKYLQCLSRNLQCDEVRPILARILGTDRDLGPCIHDLTKLAEAFGDPIRAVIDPLKWKGRSPGVWARAAIPKTFIRLSKGMLETSESSDFEVVQGVRDQTETTVAVDDDVQEDTEAAEVEGDTFKATQRTLEEMEAETKAALNHPVVRRYLIKWINRYRHEHIATKALIATDKIAVLRIVKQNPDPEIRKALLDEVCPALSQVNDSYYGKGGELLLDYVKDTGNILKPVLQACGKGPPPAWLKSFRPALKVLADAFEALRTRLVQEDQIRDDLVEITKQSRQLIVTANEFDKAHKAVITAFYKKKAAKAR